MHEAHPTQTFADLLTRESEEIVRQWLARVSDRVTVDENFLFPSEELLDHVPLLVDGMARAVVGLEPITVDTPVVMKAKELGKLRFDQGFSARQILWEYQILGAVMLNRIEAEDGYPVGPEGHTVVRRLFEALTAVQRATMEEFLDHYERTIQEREDRLRGFNHALSHELRNEIGAILGAGRMLREPFVIDAPAERERFVGMVIDNAERVEHLVTNLLELSRMETGDGRRHRNVLLRHAAEEAARSLREFAESRDVAIRLQELPPLEVNAAAVELALTNLMANSIKYHDPHRTDRWVEIRSREGSGDRVIVEVVDNGRGVPEEDRPRLFDRFFRSDAAADVEGTGLGLHLVRSALRGVDGEVWTEFPDTGETIFVFTLPARRAHDGGRAGD